MNKQPAGALAIGACAFAEPSPSAARGFSYAHYIHEVFGHAGVAYRALEAADLAAALPQLRVLVTVGETILADELQTQLRAWCEAGGAWLSIAGTCGLADLFGVKNAPPAYSFSPRAGTQTTLGEGYLCAAKTDHPLCGHLEIPLHYFNGLAVSATPDAEVIATTTNAHQHPSPYCAVAKRGRCVLIAPDAIGAIVRIQQGVAVTRDGVPAPDGSAPVSDGVLKCDDGAVLDWHFDRQDVPGVLGLRGFLQPVADQWRELVLRALFHLAREAEVALPLLWLYPRNLPALAHLSFDSDGNNRALAERLLEVLREAGINTTWCIILPGYEPEILAKIRAAGHELATHYDAMDRPWSEASFDEQWRELGELFSTRPVSNKNHYTRWEGDTEFFDWCEKRGVQLDQSKGPSKTGEIGLLFGSCHPHFPLAPDGRRINVLELPFVTQDLEVVAPATVRGPLRAAVLKAHGVLHMLFHPAHIAKLGVAEALLDTVREAQAAGLEWWTAQQINDWERARRDAQWKEDENGVALSVSQTLNEATLLFLLPAGTTVSLNGARAVTQEVMRWGFDFQAVTLDLQPEAEYVLQFCET